MEKTKNSLSILGLGITIGVILVVILVFVVDATPKKITVGGVEFDLPTANSAVQSPQCIHPQVLAQQKGWKDQGATDDKYGGWYVELSASEQLPMLWEALGAKHIYQTDTDRTLDPGRWAIYTPFDCRAQFGFSQ